MTLSNLKQAVRILFKESKITLINIFGLCISLACALFMLLWVEHELSYDRFHRDFRQLFRVEEDQYYSGKEPYHVNVTPYVSGPVWEAEVPEITGQCRMAWSGGQLFRHGDDKYFEDGIFAVDSSFFELFTFSFKYGSQDHVLRDPFSVVLTEEIAKKYFGDVNPLGKTLQMNDDQQYTIEGVLKKLPTNTVVGFHILLPWSFIESAGWYTGSWGTNSIQTFVKLREGSVDTIVNRKITEVTNIYKENNTIDFMVAPLHRIHLHSYFGFGESPGSIRYVYIFTAIAIFVLLIACINFMNLSTARSSIRAKEIGLRKINGASKGHLIRQHLLESFIQTFLSILLAFLLVLLLLSKFNLISGKEIAPLHLLSINFILGWIAILVITTFLAGSYPAFYLSSLKPILVIGEQRKGSGFLRKVLVVFQFSLAVLLITGALVVSRQLNFMQSADLGFEKSNLIHIDLRGDLNQEYEMLRQEFLRDPLILSISASIQPPYQIGSNSSGIDWKGKDPDLDLLVSYTGVHYDFIHTMGIDLTSGRDFSSDHPSDMLHDTLANFIVNQTMANIIGQEKALGMDLQFMGIHGQIVGIMNDYHFKPLSNEIEPMALAPLPAENLQHMIIRLSPDAPEASLKFIEEKWKYLLPDYPLQYNFVEDEIDDMYGTEKSMVLLLTIFSLVAIVIAALGLFALASFTTERRTREIGIRKTFGALEHQISWLMIRDFSVYIFVSLAISLPAIGYIARWWLEEFYFRIPLSADIFLLTTLIMVVVAVTTVLYHSLRIARTDPVKTLRYE